MKKLIALTLLGMPLIAAAGCNLVYGGEQSGDTFEGPTTCSGQVDSVTVNGPLTLSNATVSSITVNGPLDANSSQISSVTVNGKVTLNNSKVNTLTVNGTLESLGSTISSVEANGDLYFTNSTVGNITIDQSPTYGSYKIYLQSGTAVSGNIVFQEGNGMVYQAPGVKLTGTVTGAKVQASSANS
ncbi:MAG: hypothetical protein K0R66_1317 [Gammaproteobacteria bacterium]|jgi:hypothetical protein|nr:hypothetical protein [Gammaproteobacteria bacterium]